MKTTTCVALALVLAGGTLAARNSALRTLLTKDFVGDASREIAMVTVEYAPGASTPIHTHHAQAMVYVLEGSIVMQLRGGAPVTVKAGQTFYEGPDDVHIVSRNASTTAPARYVVFMVKDKGAPILTPAK